MTNFTGRRAIVTAATTLISQRIARALSTAGAQVVLTDPDHHALEQIANMIGTEAEPADPDTSDALPSVCADADILINVATAPPPPPTIDFDSDHFADLLRTLLEVPYLRARTAFAGMRERGFGRIITVSSEFGIPTSVYSAAFAAAQTGLGHITRVTAVEGGSHDVTTNLIDPGFVHAPPASKRHVSPQEVADLALWLASPDASLISGRTYTLRPPHPVRVPAAA